MTQRVALFISYHHADSILVNRLRQDLQSAGATIWIDHEQLVPGTPDWEEAIRTGIQASTALLYLATPQARLSPFVKAEIALARRYNLPIYALWVAGQHWEDAAPMELIKHQYLDARDSQYANAYAQLRQALGLEEPLAHPVDPAPTHAQAHPPAQTRAVSPESVRTLTAGQIVFGVTWSPDGTRMASWGNGSELNVWNVRDGSKLYGRGGNESNNNLRPIDWSPLGRLMAVGYPSGVELWYAANGGFITKVDIPKLTHLRWSPDGTRLATVSGEERSLHIGIYDVRVVGGLLQQVTLKRTLPSTGKALAAIAWSPDGRSLASIEDSVPSTASDYPRNSYPDASTLVIWDVEQGSRQIAYPHHPRACCLAWAPNGRSIATGGSDNAIHLWDVASGSPVALYLEHFDPIRSIYWSPNGRYIVSESGGLYQTSLAIKVWEATTEATVATFKANYLAGSWSPDGSMIPLIDTSYRSNTVTLWRLLDPA